MKDNNEGRLLIDIPADGNYIEILGHRIDGFESFEAFLEHLKKYAELEETVKAQNAYIERLRNSRDNWKRIAKDFDRATRENEKVFSVDFDIHSIKAEAVKECIEKIKAMSSSCVATKDGIVIAGSATYQISEVTLYEIEKEMVGEG